MTYKESCGESGVDSHGHFRQCNRPSKATRFWKDHTDPRRVCGIHARLYERLGLLVVWDQVTTQ